MVSCGDGGCCGNSGLENVYSTEEIVCGTWIDGKPIYRKVIPGKLAVENGDSYVFANVSELKIDRIINLYGNMTDKDIMTQTVLQTSYDKPNGLRTAVNMLYDTKTCEIRYHILNNEGYFSGGSANAVIEYTKK